MINHDRDGRQSERGRGRGPVGFPPDMPPERRRAYRAVLTYFLAVVAALMWPVYELASDIEPRILGVPFSLAYLVILLLGSFVVLLGLFLWEGRRYGHDEPIEGEASVEREAGRASTGRQRERPRGTEGGSRG